MRPNQTVLYFGKENERESVIKEGLSNCDFQTVQPDAFTNNSQSQQLVANSILIIDTEYADDLEVLLNKPELWNYPALFIIDLNKINNSILDKIKNEEVDFLTTPLQINELVLRIAKFIRCIETRNKLKIDSTSASEREQVYHTLFDQSSDPILLIEDGKFVECNNAACEFLGYKASSFVVGKEPYQLSPEFQPDGQASKEKAKTKVHIAFKDGKTRFEWVHKNAEGKELWVDVSLTRIQIAGKTKLYTIWRDITESKKNEEVLRRRKNTFNSFMGHIPAGIFIKDIEGRYQFINKFNEENFNVTNWQGKTAKDFFDEDLSENFSFEENEALNKGKYLSRTHLKDKNGKERYFNTQYFTIENDDGEKLLAGISLDETEARKIRFELERSEENYKSIFENSALGIFKTTPDGKIIEVNESFANIAGFKSREELLNNVNDISVLYSDPHEREKLQRLFERVGFVRNHEVSINSKQNKVIWILINASAQLGSDGEVYYEGTVADITDKKLAEQKLKDNELKLLEAQKLARMINFEIDVNDNGTISDNSKIRVLGKEWIDENPTQRIFLKRVHEDDRSRLISAINNAILNKSGYEIEFRILAFDDQLRYIHTIAKVRTNEMGKVTGIWGTSIDITSRKIAELELAESEKRYRTLFESSLEALIIHKEGVILEVNSTTLSIYRCNKEQLVGKSVLDFSSEESKEVSINRLKGDSTQPIDIIATRPDGTKFTALIDAKDIIYKGEHARLVSIRDITFAKAAQIALEESEAKYRALFENQIVAYSLNKIIYDEEGNPVNFEYIDVNSQFIIETGMKTKEEVIGKTIEELWPNLKDFWLSVCSKVDIAGKPQIIDQYFSLRNKYYKINAYSPLKGFFAVNFIDETEEILARKKLEESEKRYKSIFENSYSIMLIISPDTGQIIDANPTACIYYGYSRGELKNKNIAEINTMPQKEIAIQMAEASKHKKNYYIFQHRLASGEIRDVEVYTSNIIMNDKSVLYSIIHDITEKVKFENEVKKSEEKYRNIFDNVQIGIYRTRISDGKLIMANQRMAELFGFDSIEDAQNNYVTTEHYVDENSREELLKLLQESGRFDNFEAALTTAKGEVRWYQYSGKLYEDEGYIEGVATDLTDRKEFELELKRRNNFIQTVLDYLPIGIALNNSENGNTLYMNNKFEKIYGWPKEEINSVEDFFIKVYPDEKYRNELVAQIVEDINSRDPARMRWENCRVTHKDGSQHVVVGQNIPLPEQNTMVSTVIDVTKQKKAEEALRKSEENYRLLVENQTDLVVKIDLEGRFEFVSRTYCETFGKKERELIGSKFMPFVHDDDKATTEILMKELEKPPYQCYLEQRAKTINGWRWFAWSDKAIVDEKENIKSIIGVGRDITEMKEAQQQILNERNKAENYLETAAILMIALNTNAEVTMINQRGAEMLGYSKNYIIGKNWIDNFIPYELRAQFKLIFKEAIKGNIEYARHIENEVLCRYNKIKTFGWHNNLLKDEDGNITGVLSSAEDVTTERELKRELEETNTKLVYLTQHIQDMREEERSNLAREIHDDLGQSLTALKIDLTYLKNGTTTVDKKISKRINSALSVTNQTIKTVQDITSQLRPGLIDDLGLIPTIEWYTNEYSERSNIDVKLSMKINEQEIKESNKITIYRIVQESLTNIARHTKAKIIKVKLENKNDSVVLSITDDGQGIKKSEMEDPKSYGLLGMKERANSIKGNLTITSKPGKGTKVKLTIPS